MKCQATFADANVTTTKTIMTHYEKTTSDYGIVVTFREMLIKAEGRISLCEIVLILVERGESRLRDERADFNDETVKRPYNSIKY